MIESQERKLLAFKEFMVSLAIFILSIVIIIIGAMKNGV